MPKPWTREEVEKEPWFGGQKERVLATLDETQRLAAAVRGALHPGCIAVFHVNPKSPVCCFTCEQIQTAIAALGNL